MQVGPYNEAMIRLGTGPRIHGGGVAPYFKFMNNNKTFGAFLNIMIGIITVLGLLFCWLAFHVLRVIVYALFPVIVGAFILGTAIYFWERR